MPETEASGVLIDNILFSEPYLSKNKIVNRKSSRRVHRKTINVGTVNNHINMINILNNFKLNIILVVY